MTIFAIQPAGRAVSLGLAAALLLLAGCGEDAAQTPQASADAGGSTAAAVAADAPTEEAGASAETTPQPQAEEAAPDAVALEDKGYALGDVVLGDPNAPVTLVEYFSLTCPACKAFHEQSLPTIKEKYIDAGKVKMIIRELHGHRIGLYASALARCGGPEKYHAFVDVLFSRQDAYLTQDDDANMAVLRQVGKLGGLSNERMEACFNDEDFLRELLRFSQEHLDKDEVPATPYLIVQPGPDQETIRGAIGPEELGEALDRKLAE